MSRKYLIGFLALILSSCAYIPLDNEASPSPETLGPTVVELLSQLPKPGQTVEVDAYFSASGVPLMPSVPPSPEGQVMCPLWMFTLTDQPYPVMLFVLNGARGNTPADDAPWFLATTLEAAKPGAVTIPQFPYYGRFRGHLGDPAFKDCERANRIFVVESVVATYLEQPPEPPPQGLQRPADFASWTRYRNDDSGYELSYPPDWSVASLAEAEAGVLSTTAFHAPEWPDYPVIVRVHDHETYYDQYNPATLPPLLNGMGFGVFEQGGVFNEGNVAGAHLAGYQVSRGGVPNEQDIVILFSAGGYTFELELRYPTGFDAPQPLLAVYSSIVESFHLDVPPGPTATPPVKQTLGDGPFLSQEEALARVRERDGSETELLDAQLVPEAKARHKAEACDTFEGHPDGVWVFVVRGNYEGMTRTLRLFLDATTGEQLCGEELIFDTTPYPTLPPGTMAIPVPTTAGQP